MTTTTVVNDNRVDLGATATQNERETQTRRFAADLRRGDDRVARVRSCVTEYATVWLADGEVDFTPPAGYRVTRVFKTERGSVAVDVERTDA